MNILLMMMGGKGERFGTDIPKQFLEVNGKPIFSYIIRKYASMGIIHRIVLVCHKDWISYVRDQMEEYNLNILWHVVEGGESRSESVFHGLKRAMVYGGEDDLVLIHDATHPYVDAEGVVRTISEAEEYGGATLAGLEFDTMYKIRKDGFLESVIPRQVVVSGASPEVFKLKQLYQIYLEASQEELNNMTSAGAIALRYNVPMKIVPATVLNLKLTYLQDLLLFEKLVNDYYFKED